MTKYYQKCNLDDYYSTENIHRYKIQCYTLLFPAQCIAPLGMESGAIPDADITASSSFDSGNVGPHQAR